MTTSAAPARALFVELSGAGAGNPEVGGKGAWLDRLIAAGFPVPPTVVLTTAAYRQVVAGPDLADIVADLAAGPPPPPEDHERARRAVDDAFLAAELPAEVADAIARAGAAARRPGGMVAARSSATAEDLHGTSFAGQYRSFLELVDDAALERAVRLVWASLWHPAPRTYRRFHGVDETDLAMAVIVMRQVPADSAGVAFTVDPGGTPDVVRVEAVTGLGEQLVSGAVTPTVHLVPRNEASRADPLAAEVAALALRVEDAFGEPQDVEWARAPEGLWLLQARPVTTGAAVVDDDGFDTPDAASRRWTTAGIAEMVPGVLPPLRWEVCRLLLEEALRHHEGVLGVLPVAALAERSLVGRIRGRAALDADLLDQMEAATIAGPGRSAALRRTGVMLRSRRRAQWESGTVTVAAVELAALAPDPATLDDPGLLALRRRLIDLAGRAMAAEAAEAAAAVTAVHRLEDLLAKHLEPAEAAAWTQRVTARPGGTTAGWPAQALVASLRDAPPTALDVLAEAPSWPAALAALDHTSGGAELAGALADAVRTAGSSAVPTGPTWEERPDQWWPALRGLAVDAGHGTLPPPPDPSAPTPLDDLLDGLAANPDWRQTRIVTMQIVDIRRSAIRRQAEEAADLLERRERTKAAVLSIGGAIRRAQLELGRRLTERGRLEVADDVELLGERELVAAVAARGGPTLAELARRRRWQARQEADGPLPQHFEGRAPTTGPPAAEGDVLTGWGASPGRTRGPARVLATSDAGGLGRGDVLVARTTDASWAPLFMVAAGVIVEEGGPLSHAAIVARELGIPAVLNVPGVVARLAAEPSDVTVDGDAGTITITTATAVPPAAGDPGEPT